jgi:hypothetical protein
VSHTFDHQHSQTPTQLRSPRLNEGVLARAVGADHDVQSTTLERRRMDRGETLDLDLFSGWLAMGSLG